MYFWDASREGFRGALVAPKWSKGWKWEAKGAPKWSKGWKWEATGVSKMIKNRKKGDPDHNFSIL